VAEEKTLSVPVPTDINVRRGLLVAAGPRITEYRAVLQEGSIKCKFGVALATDIGSQVGMCV
jgi:hypothetical protein